MLRLVLIALLAGGLAGWLAAGRQLPKAIDVRGFWWLPVAFGLYWLALRGRDITGLDLSAVLMLAANGTILLVLWLNRRKLGSAVIAIGVALNLLVIVANGGWMPLSVSVLEASGHRPGAEVGDVPDWSKGRVMADEDVRFGFLADRIQKPGGGVLSVGDLIMAAGIGVFVWELMAGRSVYSVWPGLPRRSRQEGYSQP